MATLLGFISRGLRVTTPRDRVQRGVVRAGASRTQCLVQLAGAYVLKQDAIGSDEVGEKAPHCEDCRNRDKRAGDSERLDMAGAVADQVKVKEAADSHE